MKNEEKRIAWFLWHFFENLRNRFIGNGWKMNVAHSHFKFSVAQGHFKFMVAHGHLKFPVARGHLKFSVAHGHLKFLVAHSHLQIPCGTRSFQILGGTQSFQIRISHFSKNMRSFSNRVSEWAFIFKMWFFLEIVFSFWEYETFPEKLKRSSQIFCGTQSSQVFCGTQSSTNSLGHTVIQNTTPLMLPPATQMAIIDCPGHTILQTLSVWKTSFVEKTTDNGYSRIMTFDIILKIHVPGRVYGNWPKMKFHILKMKRRFRKRTTFWKWKLIPKPDLKMSACFLKSD